MDFSRNVLDHLPKENFFVWCLSCKKLKLSQNRLQYVPDDICQVKSMEWLELDSNRIVTLPNNFGQLSGMLLIYLIIMDYNYEYICLYSVETVGYF